jgi:ABC-type phosphate transport system ATPase subunit
MPADPASSGSVRSAAQLNEDIRQLWQRAGGTLSPGQRAEYERLVVAWAVAVRAEVVEAA